MAARQSPRRLVRPTGATGTIEPMRVAVIDVGSNTARLLVAEQGRAVARCGSARRRPTSASAPRSSGRGQVGRRSSTRPPSRCAASRRWRASSSAEEIDVFVTAPGRHAGERRRARRDDRARDGALRPGPLGGGGGRARLRGRGRDDVRRPASRSRSATSAAARREITVGDRRARVVLVARRSTSARCA